MEPLTYRNLRKQIVSVIRSMHARGFRRNDRIAVMSPPGPETAVAIVAIMAGFTAVPLDIRYKEADLADLFARIGIRAVVVLKGHITPAIRAAAAGRIPVLEMVPSATAGQFTIFPEMPEEKGAVEFATATDTAYILLTSGTTGDAKIILRGQAEAAFGKIRTCGLQKISATDRCLHMIPYHHGIGISASLLVPLTGGATVICPRDFIPHDFARLLMTARPTVSTATPALCWELLRALRKVPRDQLKDNPLRYIRVSSGVLPGDLQTSLEEILGAPLIDSYGMSESGLVAINVPPRKGSVGIPVSGSLAIMDDRGVPLPPGERGEIWIKDRELFHGYAGREQNNAAEFTDGWFRTGDIGYLDTDGYLFLSGRKKELINKGGEKVSPAEIDAALKMHPGVRDAMAFGIPDPVLGEEIAALVVVANNGVTEQELRHFLLDRMVHFKVPRKIIFTDAIPKNPMGKPLRAEGTKRYS